MVAMARPTANGSHLRMSGLGILTSTTKPWVIGLRA